jgi:rhodanese-related sulfurtransferase
MNAISPQDLKTKIDAAEAITIVDLQDAHEYEHRHIPGAINVPITDKCDEACATILKEKDSAIVVYGEFDELGKGSQAAETLEKMGYTNLSRLTGGLMGWMEAGYMIEGGRES